MYFLPKICLFCAVFATMTKGDINKFFPQIKGDLGNVIWAHAVNNRSYLEQTLRNAEIMMIEADVICDSQTKKAMMAHSVDDKSDLSLEKFLEEIDAFNENADILSGKGKGLKLDFKTLEAVKSSLDSIRKYNKGKYPFWLNADILPADKKIALEVNTKIEPVNADGFLSNIKFFPNSVISLGWTTDLTNSNQSYTDDNVNEMLETIKSNQVTNRITFAVRAGLTANSLQQMKNLMENETSTLTIWSSDDDYPGKVDVENLRKVIFDIGLSKIFIDVPKNLKDDLHLRSSGSRIGSTAILIVTIIIFLAMAL